MALRNEGAMRRGGSTQTNTASIITNPDQLKNVQKSLLSEEKGGIEKLMTRRNVSETKGITAAEEEQKNNSMKNKFNRDNSALLSRFTRAESKTEDKTKGDSVESEEQKKDTPQGDAPQQVKFDKKVEESDELGLRMAKKNLMRATKRINQQKTQQSSRQPWHDIAHVAADTLDDY